LEIGGFVEDQMGEYLIIERLLAGRVAIVFGAGCVGKGWGNGNATAVAYSRAGAAVVCVDAFIERANETRDRIEQEGGRAIARQADVAEAGSVADVIEDARSTYGQIDIVHNNVGITPFGGAIDLSEKDWDRCFAVNVKSIFLAAKFALPHMISRRRGVITNISSILSVRVSNYEEIAYYASKAAVNHLTKALAVRHAREGIRCNAILPGLMNTPLIHAHAGVAASHGGLEAALRERDEISPTGVQGSAWDVANAAVFLASDAANYINGIELLIDGGLTCRQATKPN
jgi:NAD(P)-dependent dehydrogenase (short-subunit alcohol dehydrogenase family)